MLIFRQTSEIVSPLARSRSNSRSSRATSSAVRRFFMGPSVAHSTEGLPFQVDQFLGGRPALINYGKGYQLIASQLGEVGFRHGGNLRKWRPRRQGVANSTV